MYNNTYYKCMVRARIFKKPHRPHPIKVAKQTTPLPQKSLWYFQQQTAQLEWTTYTLQNNIIMKSNMNWNNEVKTIIL